jgi:FkbM family methyltransferase
MLAASMVGPSGRVEAFEPAPQSSARLAENAALNGFDQVRMHRMAVGEAPGTARFVTTRGSMNHLAVDGENSGIIDVEVTTLDSMLDGDFVLGKMDIEGAELFALRGTEQRLRQANPPVWIVELNGMCERFGVSCDDIARCFTEFGYDLAEYEPSSRTLRFSRDAWKRTPNVIAVARTKRAFVEQRLAAGPS